MMHTSLRAISLKLTLKTLVNLSIAADKQEEQTMQPHMRELTTQIQHALLALPNERLLETAEQWLAPLYEQCDGLEFICACYEALGYRPRSDVTGHLYESCGDLDEAEPETVDFSWVTPEPQALRERLHTMPAEQLYDQVIDPAGEELSQKSFTWGWGAPPGNRYTGETFLQSLLGYLMLRKEAAALPTEQFERAYREQLEALAVPVQEVEEETSQEGASFFSHERLWHFRLVLATASEGQQQIIVTMLHQCGAQFLETSSVSVMEGAISYIHWHKDDLKALARARKLLNRWQAKGWLSWSAWKTKSPRRPRPQQGRHRKKKTSS
jgi:hypothetical protein